MRRNLTIALIIAAVSGPVAAGAQIPRPESEAIPGAMLGAELSVLVPRGDFQPGHRASFGYGLRGALGWGPRRMFDVGAAYRSVAHDSEVYQDTIEVKNMLRTLALTARLTAPLRYARPYIGASVGGAYFGTETMVDECCDEFGERERVLSSVRLARLAPMASMRVGLAIDLWTHRTGNPATLAIDLGLEDHYGGRATYQVGGRGERRRSGTNYRVYSLGVSLRNR